MKALLAFLILAVSLQAQAKNYFQPDYANNEEAILTGESYIFVGHATSYWDRDSSSKEGVRNLVQFSDAAGIPFVAGVHDEAFENKETAEQYFFVDEEVDILVDSYAGQHKISFPNAKKVFFGGGNITLCLCEGIRDTVRGNRHIYDGNGPLELYIVRDAVYDWFDAYDPMKKEEVDRFINNYFISNFNCPDQNWYNFPSPDLDRVKMDVFFDGELVKEYDLNPDDEFGMDQLQYQIDVHFIESKDLEFYL